MEKTIEEILEEARVYNLTPQETSTEADYVDATSAPELATTGGYMEETTESSTINISKYYSKYLMDSSIIS